MFCGRSDERKTLDKLLETARDGCGGVLVVCGAPGVGKTALLQRTIDSAPEFRIVSGEGAESEMELAFAGLHQFCTPLLEGLGRIPEPQRDALGVVFGLTRDRHPIDSWSALPR